MRTKSIFLLALFVCLHISHVCGRPDARAAETSPARLDVFRADYVKSMSDGNPEIVAAYYADEVRLMPEYQKTVIGKSHALSYHKAFAARFGVRKYGRTKVEILDLGARVVELGLFTMEVTIRSSGRVHELKGKYQNIWGKSGRGELSLITEAWNYSHHTPLAEQLRFEEVPAVHVALRAHVPVTNGISFELAALNKLMEVTIAQHDHKVWAQFYADDGMFIYSHHPLYRGRKALDDFLAKHVGELPIFEKLDVRNDRIDELANHVIEYASHIAVVRAGDFSGVSTGKDIRIWRREPGGALKIFRAMAMYD